MRSQSGRCPVTDHVPTEAHAIIEALGLERLDPEGGWFRRTWTSENSVSAAELPGSYGGERLLGTAIYYLITARNFSRIHRVPGPEVFHFYAGSPVEMFVFESDGSIDSAILGNEVLNGDQPQFVVPAGRWQACRLAPGGSYALLGTTMSPGFDEQDFQLATQADMNAWAASDQALVQAMLA